MILPGPIDDTLHHLSTLRTARDWAGAPLLILHLIVAALHWAVTFEFERRLVAAHAARLNAEAVSALVVQRARLASMSPRERIDWVNKAADAGYHGSGDPLRWTGRPIGSGAV